MTIISASQLAPQTDISAIEDILKASRQQRLRGHELEWEMRQPAFDHESSIGFPDQSAGFGEFAELAMQRFERQRETVEIDWNSVRSGHHREIFSATDSLSANYGRYLIGDSNTNGSEPGETQSSQGGRSSVEPSTGNMAIRVATATAANGSQQNWNWSGASLGAVFTKRDNGSRRVRARAMLRKRAALSLALSNFTPASIRVETEFVVANLTRQVIGNATPLYHNHSNPGDPVDHSASVPGIHMVEAWTDADPGDAILVILGLDAFITAYAHAHARFELDANLAWLGID